MPVGELSKAAAQRRLEAAEAAYGQTDKMNVEALDASMEEIQSARAAVEAAEAA